LKAFLIQRLTKIKTFSFKKWAKCKKVSTGGMFLRIELKAESGERKAENGKRKTEATLDIVKSLRFKVIHFPLSVFRSPLSVLRF